jgi:hypothetical protein
MFVVCERQNNVPVLKDPKDKGKRIRKPSQPQIPVPSTKCLRDVDAKTSQDLNPILNAAEDRNCQLIVPQNQ